MEWKEVHEGRWEATCERGDRYRIHHSPGPKEDAFRVFHNDSHVCDRTSLEDAQERCESHAAGQAHPKTIEFNRRRARREFRQGLLRDALKNIDAQVEAKFPSPKAEPEAAAAANAEVSDG